ncbi:MAG: hypothetical protein ACFHX7_20800 [Pseudomonadota bacterium]
MDGSLFLKGYYAQVPIAQFGDLSPKPEPIVLLRLRADRVFHNKHAHLFGEIGAFNENTILEIWREREIFYGHDAYASLSVTIAA